MKLSGAIVDQSIIDGIIERMREGDFNRTDLLKVVTSKSLSVHSLKKVVERLIGQFRKSNHIVSVGDGIWHWKKLEGRRQDAMDALRKYLNDDPIVLNFREAVQFALKDMDAIATGVKAYVPIGAKFHPDIEWEEPTTAHPLQGKKVIVIPKDTDQ